MKKDTIIKYLLNNFGDCLNDKMLIALLAIDGMSDDEINFVFKKNAPIAECLEPLLLKSYQTKLYLENLKYEELDLIESVLVTV